MKCGIVSSKLVRETGRWDAEYYLGDPNIDTQIEIAKKHVRQATSRLRQRKSQRRMSNKRVNEFVKQGFVKPAK